MKLILIRHAIAEDKDKFASTGKADEERPLTDEGRKKMKGVARGLLEIVEEIDVIATSPLKRAQQTAEIVGKQAADAKLVTTAALAPGSAFDDFLLWLQHIEAQSVAAVGHEPHIGSLASWLLTGEHTSHIEMKKGSALQLSFDGELKAGGAQLDWFLTPAQLRLIGD